MNRPRIAFYVPALRVGGAQKVTVTIANGFAGRGFPVDLVVSYNQGDYRTEVASEVNVVDLETRELKGVGIGASVPALRRYLDRREPSVLFSAMTFANVIALMADRLADAETQVIPTEHNTFGMDRRVKSRIVSQLAALLYGRADHVLGVSAGVVQSVVAHTRAPPSRVSVMYNPVEVKTIRAKAQEPVDHEWATDPEIDLLLNVGRQEPQKNLQMLVNAFDSVVERRPNARLMMAGSGSQHEELRQLVNDRGLADVVSLPGYVDNVYAYMARAATFVLTSRYEGLPTVLIEALACGCPIVSTDCPSGPDEILAGGKFGTLTPVGEPAAFADGVVRMLKEPPAPAGLRKRADTFGVDSVLDDYVDFVERRVKVPA